jgi:hypothetical protein
MMSDQDVRRPKDMNRPARVQPGPALRWALASLLAVLVCAAPLCLWHVPLRWYFLRLDDFVYLARSRSLPSLLQYLAAPHNGHVVPLFQLETHLFARLAGSLAALPSVLGWASYANLIVAMATTGHVVAWETGRAERGLGAMIALGLSTVLGPTILWYSAAQGLAAGTAILAMLASLQAWRVRKSWFWLVLAVLAAVAAPFFWTAGYTAGLAGLAYLWSDGRRFCRRAAFIPLAASLGTAALVWGLAGQAIVRSARFAERSAQDVSDLVRAGTHISQAICEKLVLNNLGLDAVTAPAQSVALCLVLAGIWAWTRRLCTPGLPAALPRPNPLETAGAVLVLANYGLVFATRGSRMTYDSLRALGWYDAIPQLGAVLFAAGWWSGRLDSPPPRAIEAPSARALVSVAICAGTMLLLQSPRAQRVIFLYDGMAAEMTLPDRENGSRARLPSDLAERARRQRQSLAELDSFEQRARADGLDRASVAQAIRLPVVLGMPEHLPDLRTADLLELPDIRKPSIKTEH